MVRGLNYSASIRASCPVGVISSKLRRELQRSSDPSMLDYAITHLGQGVHSNAPYFRRVTSFRDSIANMFNASHIRQRCQALGIDASDDLCHQIGALVLSQRMDPSGDQQVADALTHPHPRQRCAGVVAANLRAVSIRGESRQVIGEGLIALLQSETNPVLLQAAHQTAIVLAGGSDFGTAPQSVAKWREAFEYLSYLDSSTAASAKELTVTLSHPNDLVRAAALESVAERDMPMSHTVRVELGRALTGLLDTDDGRTRAATERALQRIGLSGKQPPPSDWTMFWDRYEAEHVHQPKAASLFRAARALEQRGRSRSALTRYRRCAEQYPRTEAGRQAAQRLRLLQRSDRDWLLQADAPN